MSDLDDDASYSGRSSGGSGNAGLANLFREHRSHNGLGNDKAGRRFSNDEGDHSSDNSGNAHVHQLDVDFRVPQDTKRATVVAFIPEITERIATASLPEMIEVQKYVLNAYEMNVNMEEAKSAEYAGQETTKRPHTGTINLGVTSYFLNAGTSVQETVIRDVQIGREALQSKALYTIAEPVEAVAAEGLEINVLKTIAEDSAAFANTEAGVDTEATMMPAPPVPRNNVSDPIETTTNPAQIALRTPKRVIRNFSAPVIDSSSTPIAPPRRTKPPKKLLILNQLTCADIDSLPVQTSSVSAICYEPLNQLACVQYLSVVRSVYAADNNGSLQESSLSLQLARRVDTPSGASEVILPLEVDVSALTAQNREVLEAYLSTNYNADIPGDPQLEFSFPIPSTPSAAGSPTVAQGTEEIKSPTELTPFPPTVEAFLSKLMGMKDRSSTPIERKTISKLDFPFQTDELPADTIQQQRKLGPEASVQQALDVIIELNESASLLEDYARNGEIPTSPPNSLALMKVSPINSSPEPPQPLALESVAAYIESLTPADGTGYRNWFENLRARSGLRNYAGMQEVNPPRVVRRRRRRRRPQQQEELPQISPLQIVGLLPTTPPQAEAALSSPTRPSRRRSPVEIISVEHLPRAKTPVKQSPAVKSPENIVNSAPGSANGSSSSRASPLVAWPKYLTENLAGLSKFAEGSEEYVRMLQENCAKLLAAGPGAPTYGPKTLSNAKQEHLQVKTMLLMELVKHQGDSFDANGLYKTRMEAAIGFRFCLELKAANLIALSADGRKVGLQK